MSTKTPMSGKERSRKHREKNRQSTRDSAKAWYWRNRDAVIAKRLEKQEQQKKMEEEFQAQKEELERLRSLVGQNS
ncbi:hypothetical protein A9K97_gp002 [Tokyovirus A1]|uniref:hypothetical protein n=1 Tax=Tokyovirus A1 TaxID=1826170 RepID=UPI0007A95E2E|nr:hypothetical protein A9K97_gp002 [Tokyovirus A1]BAU80349.1 hypothetical protein [Tokyovirus A1]